MYGACHDICIIEPVQTGNISLLAFFLNPLPKGKQPFGVIQMTDTVKDALINKFTALRAKWDSLKEEFHAALVEALQHAEKCGDVTVFDHALQCLPEKQGPLLTKWLNAFSPIVAKDSRSYKKDKSPTAKKWNIKDAMESPYYSFAPEKNETEFNVEKFIKSVITNMTKNGDSFSVEQANSLARQVKSAAKHIVDAHAETEVVIPATELVGPVSMVRQAEAA
jgi:hypothetical protein